MAERSNAADHSPAQQGTSGGGGDKGEKKGRSGGLHKRKAALLLRDPFGFDILRGNMHVCVHNSGRIQSCRRVGVCMCVLCGCACDIGGWPVELA